MKTTAATKALIYDDACPLCSLYSNGFVKWGLLNKENRISFSKLQDSVLIDKMDLQRSRHEIPLIDLEGKETLYGVDSILYLLSQKVPVLAYIRKSRILYYLSNKLYAMVSYNRKVIIPSPSSSCGINCTPDFNLKYRLVFMVFASLIASVITLLFGLHLKTILPLLPNVLTTVMLAGAMGFIVQSFIAFALLKEDFIDYMSHLAVILISGSLFLLPALWLSSLPGIVACVGLSISWMLYQYYKRIRFLRLSQWLTFSWLYYQTVGVIIGIYLLFF